MLLFELYNYAFMFVFAAIPTFMLSVLLIGDDTWLQRALIYIILFTVPVGFSWVMNKHVFGTSTRNTELLDRPGVGPFEW
jgi:hypothetical protein